MESLNNLSKKYDGLKGALTSPPFLISVLLSLIWFIPSLFRAPKGFFSEENWLLYCGPFLLILSILSLKFPKILAKYFIWNQGLLKTRFSDQWNFSFSILTSGMMLWVSLFFTVYLALKLLGHIE